MSKIKTIYLTEDKTKVEFDRPFAYVECNNLGETDVLLSTKPNFKRGDDDVIIVKAGSTATIDDFGTPTIQTIYLSGEGEVQIIGKSYAESSFNMSAKGGGAGGDGSASKPVNYIHLYGLDVQGVGAIRVDYKHPLTKSGVENLCVLMTSLASYNISGDRSYYLASATSDAIKPYDTYAEIYPYNFGSRPTILSVIITEPDN